VFCIQSVWVRFRVVVSVAVVATLVVIFVTAESPAHSRPASSMSPVVGSFGVGAGGTGGIDERTGVFEAQIPLLSSPGLGGGSVDMGVSYRHELADAGVDVFGLGAGWGWGMCSSHGRCLRG
jgi:hypothetical protein